MERKIGEIFEYKGEWYQCVKRNDCANCNFIDYCRSHSKEERDSAIGLCVSFDRSDRTQVIFKKLEKVGEPVTVKGRTFQKLKSPDTKQCKYCYFANQVCNPQLCGEESFLVEIKQTKEDMEEFRMHDAKKDIPEFDKVVDECLFGEDKLNLKPFDLEAAKTGKPVYTRDGRKARIICFDKEGEQPIVALIKNNEEESIDTFFSNGHSISKTNEVAGDLMMLPEKKEGWVNVMEGNNGKSYVGNDIYTTEDKAKEGALRFTSKLIDTIKISWEE